MRDQMVLMKHQDTNLWYIQAITGFIMFFAGSVHLYIMLTNPGSIDPYLSADRIVSGNMWFVYLVLLICVELHGTIGLYRLAMKWGWFNSKDHKGAIETRKKLKQLKNRLTIFFLSVGILALLVFIVIGIGHKDKVGQRYDAAAGAAVTVETADEGTHSGEEAAPAADDATAHETEAVEAQVHDTEAPGEAAHSTEDGHQAEEASEVGTPEAAHGTEDAGHDTAETADHGTEAPDAHGTDAHSAEETH